MLCARAASLVRALTLAVLLLACADAAASAVGGLDDATGVAWAAVGGVLHTWRTEPGPAASGHAAVTLPRAGAPAPRAGAAAAGAAAAAAASAGAPPLAAAVPHAEGAGVALLAALPDVCALVAWPDAAAPSAARAEGMLYLTATPTALLAAPGVSGCAHAPAR
jgi:hypothetical protein